MAKGFKHGTSGSTLNFKVVGNPQPANPKENTIWIDTDQKITGWEFSATQPTGPTGVMKTVSGQTITVADGSDAPIQGLKIFGKTTQNGTPTPDAPVPLVSVGDGGSVGVTVAGKNLLDASIPANQMADIGNGYYAQIFKIGRGNTVTVSLDKRYATGLTGSYIKIMVGDKTSELEDIAWLYHATAADMCSQKSTITLGYNILAVCFTTSSYAWAKDVMQVELGSQATEYEPYKEFQTLPISTPNRLPGLPVSSGGNYTDENGQQRVCDEVDFEKKKYVQRVGRKSGSNIAWAINAWIDDFIALEASVSDVVKLDTNEDAVIRCMSTAFAGKSGANRTTKKLYQRNK